MSLVAYNSSDESQDSDDDAVMQTSHVHVEDSTDRISDEGETPSIPTSLINTVKPVNGNEMQPGEGSLSTVTQLRGLPPPVHTQMAAEEDELEDVVRPKISQISDAPKPPEKRLKQRAKITIPAVQYSSDEEESEPATKKKKSCAGKSGLFSLLPEPVHAAKKEANRLLLPYTLSRKTQPKPNAVTETAVAKPLVSQSPVTKSLVSQPQKSKPSENDIISDKTLSQKHKTPFQALTGYYSDSDDDEESTGNFFSLTSSSTTTTTTSSSSAAAASSSASSNSTEVSLSTEQTMETNADLKDAEASVDERKTNSELGETASMPMTETIAHAEAPLEFKPCINQNAPLSFKSTENTAAVYGLAGPFRAKPGPAYISQHETTLSVEPCEQAAAHPESNQNDVASFMEDEQFLRLQGKKQRGKEEINIVDANMDDFVSSSNIELTKGISEESKQMSHRRNKDNAPTHTQKRKHQITYLAFQAKERELELKNTWAENRLTKKQTQAKYGF